MSRMKDYDEKFSSTGDLAEFYDYISNKEGRTKANIWYLFQIVSSVFPYLVFSFWWRLVLLKNYFKIAFRNMLRQKGYSFINIAGLALGMTCVLLILSFVRYELGYDRQRSDADRIFRVATTCYFEPCEGDLARTSPFLAAGLKNEFPEVESSGRITMAFRQNFIRVGDKTFKESWVFFADHSIFDVLPLSLISGDSKSALLEPDTAIISQSLSRKYFGESDPIGKILDWTEEDADFFHGISLSLIVTGVFRDLPPQSHLHPELICSWASRENERDYWHPFELSAMTYVKLKKGTSPSDLEAKFPAFVSSKIGPWVERYAGELHSNFKNQAAEGKLLKIFLQPLTSIHLHSHLQFEAEPNGDIKEVFAFSAIAALILALSCINFINLTTARLGTRAREVGIRKTAGAPRSRLIWQFLVETGVMTGLAFALALAAAKLALPFFSNLGGRYLKMDILADPVLLFGIIALILLVTLMAGSYPAFLLSSVQPVTVLKGNFQHGPKGRGLRRGLVVFQFAAGLILTLVTLTIFKQIRFIHSAKVGFDREQVLVVHNTYLLGPSITAFKESLSVSPEIASASVSSFLPVRSLPPFPFEIRLEGKTEPFSVRGFYVDEDYIRTMGMEIIQGKSFSKEDIKNPFEIGSLEDFNRRVPLSLPVIINETAARRFGWSDPIGKRFKFGRRECTIIGVIRDFHYSSLRQAIEPLFFLPQRTDNFVSVRLRAKDPGSAIGFIRARWKEFAKDSPLEYSFLDARFDALYRAEQRSGRLYGIFAGLAVVISALGLVGLAAFMAEQRTKEIGVRKVLGASVSNIIALISREFILLVGIANLIAWPVAYFFMKKWLEEFAYRISMGVTIFLTAGLFSLILTLLTVGIQAVKAATANPVDSLRYE
jgi:putative ABC transport system permease protein